VLSGIHEADGSAAKDSQQNGKMQAGILFDKTLIDKTLEEMLQKRIEVFKMIHIGYVELL